MSCEELLRRLAEWEDGVLPADFCRTLEAHLERCPPCAGLRDDLRRLSALCRQSSRPAMPADLRRRLRELLGSESG
jgi:hypothetical protein